MVLLLLSRFYIGTSDSCVSLGGRGRRSNCPSCQGRTRDFTTTKSLISHTNEQMACRHGSTHLKPNDYSEEERMK